MPAFEWDGSEEKAREKRIAERRDRVQERLQQQRAGAGGSGAGPTAEQAAVPTSKGRQQEARSTEVVNQVLEEAQAAAEAATHAAEQRSQQHRATCNVEEAALRQRVAQEAEASGGENRAIDLEWEQLQSIRHPQELHAAMQGVATHCQAVLASKDGVLAAIRALLKAQDDQYVKLLQLQNEEVDNMVAAMHQQQDRLREMQELELEAVEAAWLQERDEQLAAQRGVVEVLLARRSAAEQEFMGAYLAACEAYEDELERLRAQGFQEHAALRRRLDAEVASLELHLDSICATHTLNADRLDYNYRVLAEREHESKDALMQQKRRVTRQWAALNRLRKRYAALDARYAADNARLGDEYAQVARAFNRLQSKFRRLKAADLSRFQQVQGMKEEELAELLEELLEAEHLIESYVVGLPVLTEAAAGSGEPAASFDHRAGLQLELVGTALAPGVRPAATAAEQGEVSEASQTGTQRQLISAYYPVGHHHSPQAGPGPWDGLATISGDGSSIHLDAAAAAELRACTDSGALSLLLDASARRLQPDKLRELLRQVPCCRGEGLLSAAAVARSLGLQQQRTVAALEWLFGACHGSEVAATADTIRPREPAAEEQPAFAGGTFTAERVEAGLSRAVELLLSSQSVDPVQLGGELLPAADAPGTPGAGQPAAAALQPTSKQFWQARAAAALPQSVLRSWRLLEKQAHDQFSTLQRRTSNADEVVALQHENEKLRASLALLLASTASSKLHLPPTLLLQ